MSYYPYDFIEQVRQAGDIVSLIGEDTSLKGQGDRFMGLCPFPDHSEKTPSFSVSQSKQLYHCFGCQNSGNIFTYLQKQRGMSFFEAVEYLARKHGLSLPSRRGKAAGGFAPGLFDLAEKACAFYQDQLQRARRDHPVFRYLQKRGWTKEIIESFRLGYAPKGNALLAFLKSQEERKKAFSLGLLGSSARGPYDNFRDRLIFPIVSQSKQVIGFGARALDDSHPKYINSRESDIFHKGRIFYGLNESSRFLREKSSALIVEGYTDFLSLWQEGFKNLAAVLGTALTKSHARLLKRYVDSAALVFDGDAAGLKACERSLPILLSEGLEVKFISLPEGKDPDDFIRRKGKEAFQSLINSSKDLFFFVLQKKYEKLKEKGLSLVHLVDEAAPLLAEVQNPALKVLYKRRLLDLFGGDAPAIEKTLDDKIKSAKKAAAAEKSSFYKEPAAPKSEPASAPEKPMFSLSETLESERLLLILSLESEDFLKKFIAEGGFSLLKSKEMQKIFSKIEADYGQNPQGHAKLIHLIINNLSNARLIFKSSYPILDSADQESREKIFQDCMNYLRRRQAQLEAGELLAEMKMGNKEDMRRLEKMFQLTKKRLNQEDKAKA